jgi:putative ABC transport system permease protein
VPLAQAEDHRIRAMRFAIRTAASPVSIAAALRAGIRALDPNLPVAEMRLMDEVISGTMAPRRFNMILLSTFAGLALALTIVGVYGVIACTVAQRTHEIGLRMALGAQRHDVLRGVLKQGALLAAIGVSLGVAGAFLVTRLMSSLLFGVEPTDAITFAAAVAILFAVAMLASYVPARRAAKVNPLEALRSE